MKQEENIHLQVCNYLKLQYPEVIFTSESSGIRLTIGQAVKAKKMRSGSKLPDIWILEPNQYYSGLFIELKAEPHTTSTGKYKTPHIAEQAHTIEKLLDKGYYATFAVGFDQAKDVIDNYLK